MRVLFLLLGALIAVSACTLRVGHVAPTDPAYNAPGVVVGTLQIRERAGWRTMVWYCAGEVENLRAHLDRNIPVQAVTRSLAEDLLFRQVTTRPGRACGWQTVYRVSYSGSGSYRGVRTIAVYSDDWQTPIGYTIRRQW